MPMKVTLAYEKATAKYYRYVKDPDDAAPVIINLYIEKEAIDGKPRKNYKLTIEEEE